MFSVFYIVKNIVDEIKSENDFERQIYKLCKVNKKLNIYMQKYTERFYLANHSSGYILNKFILINLIHEVDYMSKENIDTINLRTYTNNKKIKTLVCHAEEKIKELKYEMKKL